MGRLQLIDPRVAENCGINPKDGRLLGCKRVQRPSSLSDSTPRAIGLSLYITSGPVHAQIPKVLTLGPVLLFIVSPRYFPHVSSQCTDSEQM
jgi:hypothetical protein